MRLKFIKPDDFVNYRKCSLFLGCISCDWKCCKEQNLPCSICQNYPWSKNPIKDFDIKDLVQMYLKDGLEEAVVIGGLEPFLQYEEMEDFIYELRCHTADDVVIYTGYYEDEIQKQVDWLKGMFTNVIIKFGRYIPNRPSRYDNVLGVTLASDNQYAKKIS